MLMARYCAKSLSCLSCLPCLSCLSITTSPTCMSLVLRSASAIGEHFQTSTINNTITAIKLSPSPHPTCMSLVLRSASAPRKTLSAWRPSSRPWGDTSRRD